MSEKDGFTGGFLAGAILGGIVGGVVGSIVTAWRKNTADNDLGTLPKSEQEVKLEGREQSDNTRRNLEDQIAQIRSTMDDMSQQLKTVIEQSVDQ